MLFIMDDHFYIALNWHWKGQQQMKCIVNAAAAKITNVQVYKTNFGCYANGNHIHCTNFLWWISFIFFWYMMYFAAFFVSHTFYFNKGKSKWILHVRFVYTIFVRIRRTFTNRFQVSSILCDNILNILSIKQLNGNFQENKWKRGR